MKPSVSVIIPACDVEDTIGRVIESVLAQDYDRAKLEIIVVDNNSRDRTPEIVCRYQVKRVFEPRRNRSRARNVGVDHASGELLAFLDADCEVPTNWLSRLTAALTHDWIGAAQALVQRAGDPPVAPSFVQGHYGIPYLDSCTLIARRSAYEAATGFNERLNRAVDMDFSFRLLACGFAFAWVPQVVVLKHHDLTLRQAARRGWVGGLNLVRLDAEWSDRVGRSPSRLFWDRAKHFIRTPIEHIYARKPRVAATVTEQSAKLLAYSYAALRRPTRPKEQFRDVGGVPQLLGPDRYLVVSGAEALLFDSKKLETTRLSEIQTALLSALLSAAPDPRRLITAVCERCHCTHEAVIEEAEGLSSLLARPLVAPASVSEASAAGRH